MPNSPNPNKLLVNKALAFGVYPSVKPRGPPLPREADEKQANHCVAFEYVLETFTIDREKACAVTCRTRR